MHIPVNTLDSPGTSTARDRLEGPAASRRTAETVVIIGNGMAGYKLCERLVHQGTRGRLRLVVIGEEPMPAYDRVHLTQMLGGRSPDQLLLAPREWYAEHGIELITGDSVLVVDRQRGTVRTESGREVGFDKLVFATGSRAAVPNIDGRDLPGVFVYRTVEDLTRIRERAAGARRAAVLGGGLLGIEAAKALKDLGLETWVVERGVTVLTRQLDIEGGKLLQAHVEKLGIHVCVQRHTERIEAMSGDLLLQFNTGECLRVQLVVFATGIRPRDELAAACGLKLDHHGGIEVDDHLRTSDPNIFALGECAAHRGTLYGLAAPAYLMAEALATTLRGGRRRFKGAELSTVLKLEGLSVAALGDFQGDGQSLVHRGAGTFRRVVMRDGRFVGAAAVGDWHENARLQEAIDHRRRFWRWNRRRFVQTGCIWPRKSSIPISSWPPGAVVCNCLGIRRQILTEACLQGCSSPEKLARLTGASTVCGSCRPLLEELCGAPVSQHRRPGARALLLASGFVMLLVLVYGLARPLTAPGSVGEPAFYRAIWNDPLGKQITGFALIGLALLSLLFSVRKRILTRLPGEVGSWRAFHAVMGTLMLAALVTHTGLRTGHNLNRVLMANILLVALLGSLAGAVTAVEARWQGPLARRLRAWWSRAHLMVAWPLAVLVVFHVLTAYYF